MRTGLWLLFLLFCCQLCIVAYFVRLHLPGSVKSKGALQQKNVTLYVRRSFVHGPHLHFFVEVRKDALNAILKNRGCPASDQPRLIKKFDSDTRYTYQAVILSCHLPTIYNQTTSFEGQTVHLTPRNEGRRNKSACNSVTFSKNAWFHDRWMKYMSRLGFFVVAYVTNPAFTLSPLLELMKRNGTLFVVNWPDYYMHAEQIQTSSALTQMDFIYRFGASCKWMSHADADDFYVFPEQNVTSFLARIEKTHPRTDYIQLPWVHLRPDCSLNASLGTELYQQVVHVAADYLFCKMIFKMTDYDVLPISEGHILSPTKRKAVVLSDVFAAHFRFGPVGHHIKSHGNDCSKYDILTSSLDNWVHKHYKNVRFT